ncbi:L,D-transpeptidase [Halomonas sp. KAO]|uniref:L,D-transpeptidase family protein n=1 Tax=Halomonas sp. KAO TaxID=2783858 RepID=UPI00189EE7EB|nr:L,D-transpeptidase [Halomonas sp. KAO]MBF7053220.1 L,D-transpeptidase [Halomonas sp. KAO]
MSSLSRRRFSRLVLASPLALLGIESARANLIETQLSRAHLPRHGEEVWVLVDDREAKLIVYRGNRELARFSPISLGRGGARPMRLQGSGATPKGEFRVNRFNHESDWHLFIGLDYPTPAHARVALDEGIYTQQDYDDYFRYYRLNGHPPQETALGGYIGLHGVGKGDPEIHRQFHWTQGCVAVTDSQIEQLSGLIDIGTRVVIR